jgi:hypothetical protein
MQRNDPVPLFQAALSVARFTVHDEFLLSEGAFPAPDTPEIARRGN